MNLDGYMDARTHAWENVDFGPGPQFGEPEDGGVYDADGYPLDPPAIDPWTGRLEDR